MAGEHDSEAGELKLYADNDRDLYEGQFMSIARNLVLKKARGTYRKDLSVKLWGDLSDSAAKKYVKDMRDPSPWYREFPPEARRLAAREWADQFETQFKLGEWDHLVPAERAAKAAKTARKRAAAPKTARRRAARR